MRIPEQEENFQVVHDIKSRVKSDDTGVSDALQFEEDKSQIGCKMQNGKKEKVLQELFIFSFFLFDQKIDAVNPENQNPDDAYRCIKNRVVAHNPAHPARFPSVDVF